MVSDRERKQHRKNRIDLYKNVNDLFEKVQNFCDGVYFEIVVEPEDQPGKRFLVNPMEEKFVMIEKEDNDDIDDDDPDVKDRLFRIERLQDNYKILLDTAYDVFTQIKKEYENENCRIIVFRRKGAVRWVPRLEVETDSEDDDNNDEVLDEDEDAGNYEEEVSEGYSVAEFDTDDENSDLIELESSFDDMSSDEEYDSDTDDTEPDSGLNSESEIHSNSEVDSEMESDPESGLD